jgi:hypothetical protein
VIALGFLVIGAALGAGVARRRGGNRLDMAQYAAGFGVASLVLGLVVTLLLARLA